MDLIKRESVDHLLSAEAYRQYMGRAMARVQYLQIVREKIKNEIPVVSLNTLRDAIYQDAVEHGLWEEADRLAKEAAEDDDIIGEKSFKEKFCKWHEAAHLIFFEGDEMLSAVEEYNWDNAVEELADVVILAFSTAGYLGIDIDAAIRRKMEINKQRPWKHGKGDA